MQVTSEFGKHLYAALDGYEFRLKYKTPHPHRPEERAWDTISVLFGTSRLLGGCGVGGLWSFNTINSDLSNFTDKAEFLAGVYRELHGAGNAIYCITNGQLSNAGHLALLEIGSREIAQFPNLCHGPYTMHLFLVNVHEAVNRFCDVNGTPYTEPREYVPYVFKQTSGVEYRLERKKDEPSNS